MGAHDVSFAIVGQFKNVGEAKRKLYENFESEVESIYQWNYKGSLPVRTSQKSFFKFCESQLNKLEKREGAVFLIPKGTKIYNAQKNLAGFKGKRNVSVYFFIGWAAD